MSGWKRGFIAFFVGNGVFFFFNAVVLWAITALDITPYGRFVARFFKGRTRDEAKEFIVGNKAVFDQMLPEAVRFSNLCILPVAALAMGVVVGLIMRPEKKVQGALWSVAFALPMAFMFISKSGASDPYVILSLSLFLVAAAAGGLTGALAASRLGNKKDKEHGDVNA